MSGVTGALSAVFWGVLLLSILVFVHEAGHYLVARAFGVRVTEFYLGLPCRFKLFTKSKKRGTEFGVTPFLLGGYNRICGMEGSEDELLASALAIVQREGRVDAEVVADELGIDTDRAYSLLATLTDWASIRPYYNPELGEVPYQRDYPKAFETLQRDASMLTEYDNGHDFDLEGSTDAGAPRPVTDAQALLVQERSHTYLGCSYPKRLAMLVAGPLVNIVLAFVMVTCGYMTMEFNRVVNEATLGSVQEGSIAAAAGLEAGDHLLSVDGTEVVDWVTVCDALDEARSAGEDFDIVYERDGVQATAHVDLPEGQAVDAIGIVAKVEPYHLTLLEAMQATMSYAGQVASTIARLVMPQHTMEVLEQSSSVVGISVMASEAASRGLLDLIALMAAISMSLGFMNLLPIPPLDGGKILIETIQVLIRRPLSLKAQTTISYVGLAFFLFIFVVAVRNDILRIMTG